MWHSVRALRFTRPYVCLTQSPGKWMGCHDFPASLHIGRAKTEDQVNNHFYRESQELPRLFCSCWLVEVKFTQIPLDCLCGKQIFDNAPFYFKWIWEIRWYTITGISTHTSRAMHLWVSDPTNIDSDNGLLPGECPTIISTNAGILLVGPLQTNFNDILFEIQKFSCNKMNLKMLSVKWQPYCLSLTVLINLHTNQSGYVEYNSFLAYMQIYSFVAK